MKWKIGLQVIYCLSIAVLTLYALIDQQNLLTELQLRLPTLEKKVRELKERNNELRYQIAQFESPERQLSLLETEYKWLMIPNESEVVEISCLPE